MLKKASTYTKGLIAGLSMIVLLLAVLLWQNLSTTDLPLADLSASISAPVPSSSTHPLQAGESIGLPVRIKIPSISVNAIVEKVALTKDGAMGIPSKPLNTAWYELGPRPGEIGSAAISGHVNWWGGLTGSFARLHKLKKGDKITVQDDKGAIITFIVRESRKYKASADATEVFISNDGKAHLNLITCTGTWNKKARQYSQRLVVFADKE